MNLTLILFIVCKIFDLVFTAVFANYDYFDFGIGFWLIMVLDLIIYTVFYVMFFINISRVKRIFKDNGIKGLVFMLRIVQVGMILFIIFSCIGAVLDGWEEFPILTKCMYIYLFFYLLFALSYWVISKSELSKFIRASNLH